MNREMNTKCIRGGGGAGAQQRSLIQCKSRSNISNSSCRVPRKSDFLGLSWKRGGSWPATLAQIGVLLILVNSIVLSSCSSISINSQSSSISKNSVLATDGHDEAMAETVPAAAAAGTLNVLPVTVTATTSAAAATPTTATTTTAQVVQQVTKGSTGTDSSAENKRKDKKDSDTSNNSGYTGTGKVRINVSNNTTAPLVPVWKPKISQPPAPAKEYWNKQQKVASVLKGAKKGK